MPEEKPDIPNNGSCLDCNAETELTTSGACSICGSNATMKRGAIKEIEERLKERDLLIERFAIAVKALKWIDENYTDMGAGVMAYRTLKELGLAPEKEENEH